MLNLNFFDKFSKVNQSTKIFIELSVAGMLFFLVLFKFISLFKLIATLLAFIVLLEVVRMISTYAFESPQVMKLRYIIDGFIVFFIRDIVLIFSDEKYTMPEKEEKLFIVVLLVMVFFIFRILALKYSPSEKDCETCTAVQK
jgi:uncharacterized membrane protein (DUF373 family)